MKIKSLLIVASVLMAVLSVHAQERSGNKFNNNDSSAAGLSASSAAPSPAELARTAFASHGGDKFRNLKSLTLLGTADVYYAATPNRVTTGKFAFVQAGGRARTDIETPDFSYREIHDGKRAYSTINAGSVWEPSKFGLPVLARFDQAGYTVTAVDDQNNQHGFRITDGEGNATDFFVDQATGRITQYSFEYHTIKFLFEHKSFKEVEGVVVPTSFLRRMSLPRAVVFMEFKVKEVKVNQPVGDDVFIIPERKA